tara:strand:+ start:687 stop:914 length:228 start_codon:yes stop_codon:yes gene_type:complete
MCVGRRPSPPPLPEPRPIAPRPEKTAERVVFGQQRTQVQKRRKTPTQRARRRLGTASLRIPLLAQEQTGTGNLRY